MDTIEPKNERVELVTTDMKEQQRKKEFNKDHALALLKRPNAKWELPKDSKFAFNGQDLTFKEGKAK